MRYHVMKARISRYFKTDANLRHVEHYAKVDSTIRMLPALLRT